MGLGMSLKVIIPFYNCEKWIVKCIKSIINQTDKTSELFIVNDASTDNSDKVLRDVFDFGGRIRYIHNKTNLGALENIVNTITMMSDPEDIIVLVDGDDWLHDDNVFEKVLKAYEDPNIWLTYGQFEYLSGKYRGICAQLITTRRYRNHRPWITSHLRTFKKHLWDRIKDQDLRDSNGNYYPMTWDLAFMYPMIEMAGLKRIKYIKDVLYTYNDLNPINDDKKNSELQRKLTTEIRAKDLYDEII